MIENYKKNQFCYLLDIENLLQKIEPNKITGVNESNLLRQIKDRINEISDQVDSACPF